MGVRLPARVAAASIAVAGSSVFGQCQYEFVAVYPAVPSIWSVSLADISNSGWAGGSQGGDGPVLVSPEGAVTLLPVPIGDGVVNAISDSGHIVGEVSNSSSYSSPAAWVAGAAVVLTAPFTVYNGYALDVNDNGWIVGFVNGGEPGAGPCVWANGELIPLYESLTGFATGVSETNEVSGWSDLPGTNIQQPYLWRDGVLTWLPLPDGMLEARTHGASTNGIVVGDCWFEDLTTSRATVWRAGQAIELGVPPEFTRTRGYAVNALGQVVGITERVQYPELSQQQILWLDGQPHFLFSLLTSPFVGTVTGVSGINDRGEICGRGRDQSGESIGLILRPIRTRAGDVTIDCTVDVRDLTALFEFWGRAYTYDDGPGDLDGDRLVGPSDLALLLGDWG